MLKKFKKKYLFLAKTLNLHNTGIFEMEVFVCDWFVNVT